MPKRPPKAWWNKCTAGVAESNRLYDRDADPRSVCGSLWYHKMRASDKRTIVQQAEAKKMRDNPVTLRVREGTRVRFMPTPASYALYSSPPTRRAEGVVSRVSFGGSSRTSLPGPGGGLVYVKWDDGSFQGVSPIDLVKVEEDLAENPVMGGGATLLVVAAAAGLAWILLRSSKAAPPPSGAANPEDMDMKTLPPVKAPDVPTILPPKSNPVPVPNLPTPNCGSKIYVTYKFTGTPLVINVFRRLSVWDTKASYYNSDVYTDGLWLPPNAEFLFKADPSSDIEKQLDELSKEGVESGVRYLAEAWVQAIDGWCLAATSTNYEPWTAPTASPSSVPSASPSSVVTPPAPPAPSSSLTQEASLAPATPELGRRGGGGSPPHISPPKIHIREQSAPRPNK